MLRAVRLDGVKALRQIGLLDSLTLDDLSQLYHFCTPCTFEPGEMVLREGENDDYMVFALSGRLEVLGEYACTIPSPDYIGQDGISPFVQRNASVRACDRVVALRLARRDFVDVYDAFAATPLAAELDRIVQDVGLRDMAHLREYLRDVEVRRPAIAPAAAAPAGPRFAAGSASAPPSGFRISAAARPPRLRSLADPLVASNFLFALCSALYALSAHWVQATLVLVSCVASCAYHRSRESRYALIDRYGAATAFFATLSPLIALRSAPVTAAIALDCVVAFSFYFRCGTDRELPAYSRNHSMWHASIFVGQMIVACALL